MHNDRRSELVGEHVFYFIPKNSIDDPVSHWQNFCSDSLYEVYKGSTLIKMNGVAAIEKSGKGFRGNDFKIKKVKS